MAARIRCQRANGTALPGLRTVRPAEIVERDWHFMASRRWTENLAHFSMKLLLMMLLTADSLCPASEATMIWHPRIFLCGDQVSIEIVGLFSRMEIRILPTNCLLAKDDLSCLASSTNKMSCQSSCWLSCRPASRRRHLSFNIRER